MFIIVGVWGGRARKISAAYKLMIYTVGGSVLMLLAILYLYYSCGTGDLYIVLCHNFTTARVEFLWFCFFIAFAVKVPLIPFHLWLPEAHVEAPTGGSIILAGMLLKLGTFGILRFLVGFLPKGLNYFQPLVVTLAIIGVVFTGFTTLRQVDVKKIIAYSSVGHMSLVVLGLVVSNLSGLFGAVAMMLAHGVVSSGLFAAVGVIYERTHTRILHYYGGLASFMPMFSFLVFLLVLANFSVPGTVSFSGELLLALGIFISNPPAAFLCCFGLFLCTIYSVRFFNRAFFGAFSPAFSSH